MLFIFDLNNFQRAIKKIFKIVDFDKILIYLELSGPRMLMAKMHGFSNVAKLSQVIVLFLFLAG
jgi:hypothetical protein